MSQPISEPVNNLDFIAFNQCFYGCKLDSKTLKWKCKFTTTIKDADTFSIDPQNSLASKIVPVNCLFAKYPNFIKQSYLKSHLAFDIDAKE